MRKYFYLYRLGLLDMMSDAGKTFIWMFVEAARALVLIFIWSATTETSNEVGELTRSDLIVYYLFIFMAWFIVGGIFHHMMERTVADGSFSNYLLKPLLPFSKEILSEQAWKTFGFFTSIPLLLVLILMFFRNIEFQFQLTPTLLAIVALLGGGLLFVFIDYLIGIFAFWTHRVDGVASMAGALNAVFGGYLVPFILLPDNLRMVGKLLPFRYTFSFPVEVMQGKLQHGEIVEGYVLQALWILATAAIVFVSNKFAIRKYESFGN